MKQYVDKYNESAEDPFSYDYTYDYDDDLSFDLSFGSRKARSADNDETKAARKRKTFKKRKAWKKLVRQERRLNENHEKRLEKSKTAMERDLRSERREWNKKHEALLAFYASVEEKYKSICPDLNLYDGLLESDQFNSYGAWTPQPRYLSLPEFEKCMSSKSMGSFSVWCIPKNRPDECSSKDAKLTFAKLSTGFYSLDFCSDE